LVTSPTQNAERGMRNDELKTKNATLHHLFFIHRSSFIIHR
jgi:hypothetical protein